MQNGKHISKYVLDFYIASLQSTILSNALQNSSARFPDHLENKNEK